jgi:ABC-type dipeptide/oligopeptide/nickel transport system permease component
LAALGTVLAALALIFLASRTLPNNPVLARFGQHSVPEALEKEMARQGWDRPLWEQFVDYLSTFSRRATWANRCSVRART